MTVTRTEWTEQQLLDNVIDLATRMRWAVHHDRPARRSGNRWTTAIQGHAGFPDLVLARAGLVMLRELKGYNARGQLGKLSPEQRDWARQLTGWTQPVEAVRRFARTDERQRWPFDVWTPDDWDAVIVPTLTARVSRPDLSDQTESRTTP